MTLAQLRTALRGLIRESETDSGTVFPSDNVLLDFYLNLGKDLVTIDLARFAPSSLIDYEDITLVAGTASYTTTKTWLQVLSLNRNITGDTPRPLTYVDVFDEAHAQNVAETAVEPEYWTIKGATVRFLPIPASAKTAYARLWMISDEGDLATGGPTLIPRLGQKLIPFAAAYYVGLMLEGVDAQKWLQTYQVLLEKTSDVLSYQVQGQPRFLKESFASKRFLDARDKALYDTSGFFD